MTHDNRDIAQEGAEQFLSKEIWEISDEYYLKNAWNKIYVVKISKKLKKREPVDVGGILKLVDVVKTHLAVFEAKKGVLEIIREKIGVVGSLCLYVTRNPKKVKSMWNLPFVKQGGLIIPDGCASSLIMDSVSKLPKGINRPRPELYASLGKGA